MAKQLYNVKHLQQNYKTKYAQRQIDYLKINDICLGAIHELLSHWLPGGRYEGHEYIALNPKRNDSSLGSFKINIRNGKWADFATGDSGHDIISLASYLSGGSQSETATKLLLMLGGRHG